jgi:DNA-binding CsgD family transcriptional regulator
MVREMAATRVPGLLGRTGERDVLDRLLGDVRGGQSAALLIRGEAGIGKTALLHYAARRASGFGVARIAGIEAEMELPFAAVHQLCGPKLDRLEALPGPQRDALSVALGLSSGEPPDRFLVAMAVLSLLSAVAEDRPLLCLVDDAQWLDVASGQVLGFVARRLLAESVAVVVAVREPGRSDLDGLPTVRLGGLDESSARALLGRAVPGRLDDQVRDRLVAEGGGNPLALLELPRGMSAAELAGGFELHAARDLPSHIEVHYVRRVEALPAATRRLVVLAAADPTGDATAVWRAAQTLGIGPEALAPAEREELLEIGARVRFRHPLVRSAAYRAASVSDRRRAHEALAAATDPDVDDDRRAWHRALAVSGFDEDVAAELEHSAGRAHTRGGLAAAAAFLERAAALTSDPACRARRALAAAQAKHEAGTPDAALALLANAEAGPLEALQRAQADLLRARITFTVNRGSEAPPLLLQAAKQLEALDVTLARETYLEALMAVQFAGRLSPGAVLEVGAAAHSAPPSPSPRAPDLLLDALALMITEGHAAAAPLLKRTLEAFRGGDIVANGGFRWLWLVTFAAIEVWDHDAWYELAVRQLQLVRDAGALSTLPLALSAVIVAQIFAGELAAATSAVEEVKIVTDATGTPLTPYGPLILAAWRGQDGNLSRMLDAAHEEAMARGEGIGVSVTQWVRALFHNGRGEYESALAAARQVIERPSALDNQLNWVLPELVEAAVRSGHRQLAHHAVEQLSEMTRATGSDWASGLESRSRALVSEHGLAEHLYREAIERLGRTRVRGEHARAHLLYGEWLRREGRRKDAREQLKTAHRMFTEMEIEGFADRARRELLATGATVRARRTEARDDLTAQERQIARLARDGLSNPEIGARLFLSPRTVEWHLHHVFTKLGIRSRRGLAGALGGPDSGLVAG